jgi:diguanylate cyclase (GGDEF)-like protein
MFPKLSFLGRFAALSAVAIVLIGVVLARSMQTLIHDRAIDNAEKSAELVARVGIQAHLDAPEFGRPLGSESHAMLDESVRADDVLGGQISSFTIWNRDLDVLYSSSHDDAGSMPGSAGEPDVVRDEPVTATTRALLDEALRGSTGTAVEVVPVPAGTAGETEKELAVYVPVRFESEKNPVGALRISQPYAPIETAMARDTRWLLGVLGFCLLVLYAFLYRLVQKASRALQEQSKENAHQAMHDALTGLPNRTLFRDRVAQAVASSRRSETRFALMLLDLDRFKEINDTLGHHNGDRFLQQIGPRLQSGLREVDSIARLGGDEFGILLPGVGEGEAAGLVAEKIRAALEKPFVLQDIRLSVEASVGISLFPDVDTLIQRADVAMYVAKASHAGHGVYDIESDRYTPRRLAMLGELRKAIENRELVLYYQPVADLRTGSVGAVEALVRWEHPEHGLIGPEEFVTLAEHTGLIGPLTHYVLDTALRQCHIWRTDGLELLVSVNLSVRNLLDADLPQAVERLLSKWRLEPSSLRLELTENTIMADPARALAVLERLRDLGVGLALDDFGAGYSSLGYLKRLPVDELKIDRSFVMSMATSENDAVIVRSTIDLSRNLGLTVVAEGVETEEVWNLLADLGCDRAQGSFLTHPLAPAELTAWLREPTPNAKATRRRQVTAFPAVRPSTAS